MSCSHRTMASELKLYKKYEAGLRYLLAQSPDSRGLVPETQESAWEKLGTKNGVEVHRQCLQYCACETISPCLQLPYSAFYTAEKCLLIDSLLVWSVCKARS